MPGSVSGRRSPAGQRQCARSLASIRETPCRQGQRRSARQRPGAETENSCSGLAETGLRPNRLMVTCCRQARNDPTDARRIIAAFAASRAVGQRRVFGPRGGRRTAPRRRGNRHVPAKPEARSVSGLLRKGPAHHGSALRERADGNCVGSQALPIANFRESRNDQLFRRSSFFRFAVAIFRRQPHTLILTTIWQKL
jgi:hypothetical protein